MNKFALIILSLCASVATSSAQYVRGSSQTTVMDGGTNNVANLATNTYAAGVIDATQQDHVAVALKYSFHAAPAGGTPAIVFRFASSVDGTIYETTPKWVITCSGATNTCIVITNLSTYAYPYLRLSTIENTNSAVITNVSIVYNIKN